MSYPIRSYKILIILLWRISVFHAIKAKIILIHRKHNDDIYYCSLGLAAVVGGVFSNLANAANAILSSPSKIGISFPF